MSEARAVVLPAFDEPVRVERFEVPDPKPGAILAEVAFGGVCGTDVHLQAGRLPIPTPLVLGHEGVGRVRALGEGVSEDSLGVPLAEGDAISWGSNISCGACFFCRNAAEPTLCERRRVYGITRAAETWPHLTGAWADTIYLEPGSTVVRLDADAPPEAVIALGCAGPTAVHGVLHVAPVRVGESVVVQGAGPVGLAAAMYAHVAGAGRVVIVGAPKGRLDLAARLVIGDERLNVDDLAVEERVERVREQLNGGRGADLVIECTGVPPAVAEGLDMCRAGGRYLILGQYTDHGPTPLNPHLVTRKQLAVLGSWAFASRHVVEYVRTVPTLLERFDLAQLLTTFPLEQAQDALDAAREGRVTKAALAAAGSG